MKHAPTQNRVRVVFRGAPHCPEETHTLALTEYCVDFVRAVIRNARAHAERQGHTYINVGYSNHDGVRRHWRLQHD